MVKFGVVAQGSLLISVFSMIYTHYVIESINTLNMFNIEKITPASLRLLNRKGGNFLESSSGACSGYLQLNMAMLSKEYASDFGEFCARNSSACPLVYKSEVGEVEAPRLAEQSDIRYYILRVIVIVIFNINT